MLRLQEDYLFLEKFNSDPDKVMDEIGILSDETRNILKSKDLVRIGQLLSQSE